MTSHDAMNAAIRAAVRGTAPEPAEQDAEPVATDFDAGVRTTTPAPPDVNQQIREAHQRIRTSGRLNPDAFTF